MRWFGGHIGADGPARLPAGARLLWTASALWVVGDWPAGSVRTLTGAGGRAVAVIGSWAATDDELRALLDRVPDAAVTAWAGAYTIIHTTGSGEVTIVTDPAHACPLYTTPTPGGGLVWGSSSRALSALAGNRIDERWLAAHLINPTADTGSRSAWAGVDMLPPGHRFTATGHRAPRLTQVWAPTQLAVTDAVDRLRATLTDAVRARVATATSPGSDLSGGLDSSTLAVLAAQTRTVTAVTIHPAGVTGGGDLDHARMVATAQPNLRHLLLPLHDRHLPYTGLGEHSDLPATDEPAPSTLTWAMLSAQLRLLAADGVDCHLTGDGGDTLFLPPPAHLTDLARRGRWLRLLTDTCRWARLRRTSPWTLLTHAVAGNTAALAGTGGPPPWFTPHATRLAAAAHPVDGPAGLGYADRLLLAETRHVARTAHTEAHLADTHGIALHNPYLDARVLDTVLAVPAWLRTSPHRYKPLLTQATAGLLPEPVRLRAAKGVFAGDHHRGLRANLHQVLDLADGHLAGYGLVDPPRVRTAIHRAAAGLHTVWGHLEPLLATEIWLRTITATPGASWTTPTHQAAEAAPA